MPARSPEERALIARIGAASRLAKTPDTRTLTEKARAARRAQFERQALEACPGLTGDALARKADDLMRAHMLRMTLKAKQARRKAREAVVAADAAERALRTISTCPPPDPAPRENTRMTRSRASAKAAGTRTETAVAAYLAEHVDDRVERRRLSGPRDRGDIAGLRVHGQRLVVEVKDCSRVEIGPWLNEAEIERGNDDALAGVVVAKRRGKGSPADLTVLMTLADLVALLTGSRP